MKIPKTKPPQVRLRRVHKQRLKSFNAPIIANSSPKSQEFGYQKLINHVVSGDSESARELLENSGYSGVLADFLLDNAELDSQLEILAAIMPVGGQDD